MKNKRIYRIIFINQDTLYEIYARSVSECEIFSFITVEEFVWGKDDSIVIDPSEENLKLEFNDVKRSFIPMHAIVRIDEVDKEGAAKISEIKGTSNNVSAFPSKVYTKPDVQ